MIAPQTSPGRTVQPRAMTLAWLVAGLIASCVGGLHGFWPGEDIPFAEAPALRRETPLDCRMVWLPPSQQRALLARSEPFRSAPVFRLSQVRRNPLLADAVEVCVENTSGAEYPVYAWSNDPFWISVQIGDSAGRQVVFPHAGPSSLKQLSAVIGHTPIMALKPGQVIRLRKCLWSRLNDLDLPKPGRYTARVVCSYYRAPDGKNCVLESAPIPLIITAQDVRDFKVIWNVRMNSPIPISEPGPRRQ